MSNKCGGCQLFEGPTKKCGAGRSVTGGNSAPSHCFKGPASLFKSKVCGGCRLFQGPSQKCGAGRSVTGGNSAPSHCFSPIPG